MDFEEEAEHLGRAWMSRELRWSLREKDSGLERVRAQKYKVFCGGDAEKQIFFMWKVCEDDFL